MTKNINYESGQFSLPRVNKNYYSKLMFYDSQTLV